MQGQVNQFRLLYDKNNCGTILLIFNRKILTYRNHDGGDDDGDRGDGDGDRDDGDRDRDDGDGDRGDGVGNVDKNFRAGRLLEFP